MNNKTFNYWIIHKRILTFKVTRLEDLLYITIVSYYISHKIHEGPIYTIIIAMTSLHFVPEGSLNKFNCTYFTGKCIITTSTLYNMDHLIVLLFSI